MAYQCSGYEIMLTLWLYLNQSFLIHMVETFIVLVILFLAAPLCLWIIIYSSFALSSFFITHICRLPICIHSFVYFDPHTPVSRVNLEIMFTYVLACSDWRYTIWTRDNVDPYYQDKCLDFKLEFSFKSKKNMMKWWSTHMSNFDHCVVVNNGKYEWIFDEIENINSVCTKRFVVKNISTLI